MESTTNAVKTLKDAHGVSAADLTDRGTCIRWGTQGCRDMLVENSEQLTGTMVFLSFRTLTLISSVRILSMFTQCVSRRVNSGVTRPAPEIRSILICGTTTLNQPNAVPQPETLAALPRLPHDEGGPVFAEPWQAQAFALAAKLSEQGHFTWKEWATALADELKAAADRGERLLALL